MYLKKSLISQLLFYLSNTFIYFIIIIKYLQHDLILNGSYRHSFFNSDALFFNNLSLSLLKNESFFSDWIITGAPRIFPSISLNLLVNSIFQNNFVAHIVF